MGRRKAFLSGPGVNADSEHRKCPPQLYPPTPPRWVHPELCSGQSLLLLRLAKPVSLIQMYTIASASLSIRM